MTKMRGSTTSAPRSYTLGEWLRGYAAWLITLPLYIGLWAFAKAFKRIPDWLLRKLLREHERVTERRPDVRIGIGSEKPDSDAYMLRWWRIPRNAFFNIYFHIVQKSDEDAALHDHPWWNFSIVLEGGYYEYRILEGGCHLIKRCNPGDVLFRGSGRYTHRLQLLPNFERLPGDERPAKTIFITGPVLRRWGFHHPDRWVDAYEWDDFCRENKVASNRMGDYADQVKGQRHD